MLHTTSAKICFAILFFSQSWFLHNPILADERSDAVRKNYTKFEYKIPMRDGVHLFTSVYVPNDLDPSKKFPILLLRTPYSCSPYGLDKYRSTIGPSPEFEKSGYVFAFQDVRGRYMSEGEFDNMRPHRVQKGERDIDESSDTFDTIDWLVRNIPRNNGRVGLWGISYPGFYSSAGAIDSHPALKAVSPQAPIADWFFDDFHRNGAFVLPMGFNFFSSFGRARPNPTIEGAKSFEFPTKDGYQFFLDMGPLRNVDKKYFKDEIAFWNDIESHPNYDEFWQSRNILPHLKNIKASVLVVGGWFDTEDLYGPLATYAAIEKQNPNSENRIVMGPWYHGGWNRDDGQKLGQADFGFPTGQWFRDNVQFPFFEYHLKSSGTLALPEATMFETGSNRWRQFDKWPPASAQSKSIYMGSSGTLAWDKATNSEGSPTSEFDRFVSDPNKPVPYTTEITTAWARDYVTEDQRFAAWRPDVLVYRTEPLETALTLAGPIQADLWVSTSASDADWIVKVIDEFPGQINEGGRGREEKPGESLLSGRQQLVRAGVLRGRFRDSFAQPKPMQSGEPTHVAFEISDILHTFQPGHRLMVQVQSTWFPFIDRNPQKFVPNIFMAEESDFTLAEHRLYRSSKLPSSIRVNVLP
jgi:uncharacterized protein